MHKSDKPPDIPGESVCVGKLVQYVPVFKDLDIFTACFPPIP